jgi:putative lipoic acid-binding regulatory protein
MNKPNLFPGKAAVKVFYVEQAELYSELVDIVRQKFPMIQDEQISKKFSAQNKYTVVTFELYVEEQKSLEALYEVLTRHPNITMVL